MSRASARRLASPTGISSGGSTGVRSRTSAATSSAASIGYVDALIATRSLGGVRDNLEVEPRAEASEARDNRRPQREDEQHVAERAQRVVQQRRREVELAEVPKSRSKVEAGSPAEGGGAPVVGSPVLDVGQSAEQEARKSADRGQDKQPRPARRHARPSGQARRARQRAGPSRGQQLVGNVRPERAESHVRGEDREGSAHEAEARTERAAG